MTRKEFLGTTFSGILGGILVMMGFGCSSPTSPSDGGGDGTQDENEKAFQSTTAEGHAHSVTIQRSEIENPPENGISRSTSVSGGHSHTFSMTQQQLQNVRAGETVRVTDSVVSGHSHEYQISKWY